MDPWLIAEVAVRGVVYLIMAIVFFGAIALVRRIWRAITRTTLEGVAHKAGSVAANVERRSAGFTRAFKEGRDGARRS
jgi:hypothetical protein